MLALGWALPGWAQPKWAVGQTYSGNIDIGGVQVPLLPGEWTLMAHERSISKARASSFDAGGHVIVALARIVGGKIPAYMVFFYNEQSRSKGWDVTDAAQCRRQDIHHTRIVRDVQLDRACQYVNHTVFTVSEKSAGWWKAMVEQSRKIGTSLPQTVILSGIVVSDRSNFISAAYSFSPEASGFPPPNNLAWTTSDWNKGNVAGDEKKKAFVQSVVDWTERSRPVVEAGLAGKLKKGEGLDWPAAMQ